MELSIDEALQQGIAAHQEGKLQEAEKLYADESKNNPKFKKIFTSWNRFRNDQNNWFRVAENSMASYIPRSK